MTGVLLVLVSVGLIGGFGLITAGSKQLKPITFPNSFYDDLKYFKHEYNEVTAVKKNDSTEIVFEGTPKSAEKYFNQVQLGFEKWLNDNDSTSTVDNGGSVNF